MNTLRGSDLIKAAVNQILQHPETWDQGYWHGKCGTTHCIAGWCQILAGKDPDAHSALDDAKKALGITYRQADWLFSTSRSLSQIHSFAKHMIENPTGYDPAGYDPAGYHRDGYNRAGYDRDGYDRDGYNRAGYDPAGYDPAGYDRDGYHRDGYNRAGYDRAGKSLPLL